MDSKKLERRYRVVVLGGGIHGVGIAHDLATRGWKDVLVLEKSNFGSGTSSKSTKLIHGGLRYLKHPRDFPLVSEGLEERALLAKLAPDLVKTIPFIFPVLKKGGMPRAIVKIGLWLYDFLSYGKSLGNHHWISIEEAKAEASILNMNEFKGFYKFFDGQTDDLALVRRVAESASKLGANLVSSIEVNKIAKDANGWVVHASTMDSNYEITAKYVVNALGPWAHELYQRSDILPKVEGINNLGVHLLVRDLGLKVGLFLQSPSDGRIFFVLPWLGFTLIGTTEDHFEGTADSSKPTEAQINYLLKRCNQYLNIKLRESDIISSFAGLRWLSKDSKSGISDTSRSHLITEHHFSSNILYTIYGGKLTAYRALSKEIGNKIVKAFGDDSVSKTHLKEMWAEPEDLPLEMTVPLRFK